MANTYEMLDGGDLVNTLDKRGRIIETNRASNGFHATRDYREDGTFQTFVVHQTGDVEHVYAPKSIHNSLHIQDINPRHVVADVGTCEDGIIRSVLFHDSHGWTETYISNGCGSVVVYPEHPKYASFPQQEEEVDPSGSLGKIVASWDVNYKG